MQSKTVNNDICEWYSNTVTVNIVNTAANINVLILYDLFLTQIH